MIKRTVEISSDGCYVHQKNSQLLIEKDGEKIGSVPIEDLAVLIIDSNQITLSSGLITSLAEANIAVIFTDAKHPSGFDFFAFYKQHNSKQNSCSANSNFNSTEKAFVGGNNFRQNS